jgi:hypothetical protein
VRTGDRPLALRRGAGIGTTLTEAARTFIRDQGAAAVAAAAPDGTLWASLWCGVPGFLRADENGERIEVRTSLNRAVAEDPVRRIIRGSAPLGMLLINFDTRRRLRVNGTISRLDPEALELTVAEAWGNCIKYIQRRQLSETAPRDAITRVESGHALDDERRAFIAQTDTLFVASIHPQRGLDVSHRGGPPGFVKTHGEQTLRIPDYMGNGMFQTLGNWEVDARAGLALIDFDRRRVLSLTGRARADFGAEDPRHPTGGTGRYWSFAVERWVEFPLPPGVTWTLIERSTFNPSPFQP